MCDLAAKRCMADMGDGGEDGGGWGSDAGLPDTCKTAWTISFPGGNMVTNFVVDTTAFSDDYDAGCSPDPNHDAVYRLVLTAAQDVTITASPASGGAADPIIFLKNSPCETGTIVDCQDRQTVQPEVIKRYNLGAGTYFLFVEGFVSGGDGPIDVTVELGPPTLPPANDDCVSPIDLVFVGNIATASGTTLGAQNSQTGGASPSCSPTALASGPDVVYTYTVAGSNQDVQIKVKPTGTPVRLYPVVYLRKPGQCGSTSASDELFCMGTSSSSGVAKTLLNQPPGKYYLWVDGLSGSAGPFDVTVELAPPTLPPANDECAGVIALAFDGGIALASGTTLGATNSNSDGGAPTCSPSARSSGPDVVYSFTVPDVKDVKATVTPTGAPLTFNPVVSVRKPGQCASSLAADQLGCTSNLTTAPSVVNLKSQAPGTYFLWVDGAYSSSGPFDVKVELNDPVVVPNDTCASPSPILFVDGGTSVTWFVDTANYNDDYKGQGDGLTCTGLLAGTEAVYRLDLAIAQDVTITTAAAGGSGADPVVYLRQSPCDAGTEIACADEYQAPEVLQVPSLAPGSYFLFVDSYSPGSAGLTEVTVSLSGPGSFDGGAADSGSFQDAGGFDGGSPDGGVRGDTCQNPVDLAFDQNGVANPVIADTSLAANDYGNPSCGPDQPNSGRDLVYRLVTTKPRRLTVVVFPQSPNPAAGADPTLRPFVYLRTAADCASVAWEGSLGCSNTARAGEAGLMWISELLAGTYYLIVDGSSRSNGPFYLAVSQEPIDPQATNETCSSAQPLTFVDGKTVVSGSTRDAGNDLTLACFAASTAASADVAYTFTTPGTPGTYNVRAMAVSLNANELSPVVNVRSGCANDAGTSVACQGTSSTPHHAVAIAVGLTSSTQYSIWVDAADAGVREGPFALEVDLARQGVANDSCLSAQPLVANDGGVIGNTLGAADDLNTDGGWYTSPWNDCPSSASETYQGADVVYSFTPLATGFTTVRVTPQRGYDVALAVLYTCQTDDCLYFKNSSGSSDFEEITFFAFAGHTYYFVVDYAKVAANPSSRGQFEIKVTQ